MSNYTISEELKQQIFSGLDQKGLNPKEHGGYLSCQCPKCQNPDAFAYFGAGFHSWIICNHRKNCGYREQLKNFLGITLPEKDTSKEIRLAFANHGLSMEGLSFLIGDPKEPSILLGERDGVTYSKTLRWKTDEKKYRWFATKGFTANMLEFYPVLHPGQNILYVFEGEWDWMKGIEDGLACTSSLFGAGYRPKTENGWAVFASFDEIRICQQNDPAGETGAGKLSLALKEKFPTKKVAIIKLPLADGEGKDYCDFRLKHSLDEFLDVKPVEVEPQKTKAEIRREKQQARYEKSKQGATPLEGTETKRFPLSKNDAFIVTESGIFFEQIVVNPLAMGAITEANTVKTYTKICDDDVIVVDRAKIAEEEKNAYVTLSWKNNEIIVPMSYLQAKNSDKLADRGIRILANDKAKNMTSYFEVALRNIPTRTVYKRLGWHGEKFVIPGMVEDREILPESKLNFSVENGDVEKGMACLEACVKVTSDFAFLPFLLTALLAPASKKLGLDQYKFCPFAVGQTGNFKTTLAKHATMIYGRELGKSFLRFGEGATVGSIIKTCSTASDLPILIDNYKPNLAGGEADLLKIVQAVVEGKEKLRLDQQGNFRPSETLGAWVLITGEASIQDDTSAIARCLEIQFKKSTDALKHLETISQHESELPSLGKAWLEWLQGDDGQKACDSTKNRWIEINRKWNEVANKSGAQNSARIAANLSCLEIAFELATTSQLFSWLSKYETGLLELLYKILGGMSKTTLEAREGTRFLESLSELIASGSVILAENKAAHPSTTDTKQFIGWDDKPNESVYLLPSVALQAAKKLKDIRITNNSLHSQLDELGAIAEKDKDQITVLRRVGGKQQRVLAISRKFLFSEDEQIQTLEN